MTTGVAAPRSQGQDRSSGIASLELSVIVPSFNERQNVAPLIEKLESALAHVNWEVVYVDDDSPDGTAELVREIGQKDSRVRCVQRVGRRGLSSAVIEGILATSAPFVAVIDADLQHDETLLPSMLARIKDEGLDIVVASRYIEGGGTGNLESSRAAMSRFATRLSRLIAPQSLSDPMSGFFMIRRPAFERSMRRLSGQGFKVLLDLFASAPEPYRFAELPYAFRRRIHGESKLDSLVVWEYLMLLLDKRLGGLIPPRFVVFMAVGGSGVVVHLSALRLLLSVMPFAPAQLLASGIAMVSNFLFNNALTYRDRRLRGFDLARGLMTFAAICSIGAIANVRFAAAAYAQDYSWWVSGIAGAVVGSVWNYAVSAFFTWRSR